MDGRGLLCGTRPSSDRLPSLKLSRAPPLHTGVLVGSGGAKPSRTLHRAHSGDAAAADEQGAHRRSLQPALALVPSLHAPGRSSGVTGTPAPPLAPPLALPAPLAPPCARLRFFLCAEGKRRGLLLGGGAALGAPLDASPPPQGARPTRLLLRLLAMLAMLAMLLLCPVLPPPDSRHGGVERALPSTSLRMSC